MTDTKWYAISPPPIQDYSHRGPKVAISKSVSSTDIHVIKRLMASHDIPRQYSI